MNDTHITSQPIDSRQLRAFVVLAATGSFTETARLLHLSQSAISHSMKALEEDVGCLLLDRMGKKVILTQAGEAFLGHAQKILEEMAAAREELGQLGKWGRGRLRLGASLTACQYILPAVLREFKESFPHCLIHIEPGDTVENLDLLRQGKIDLALAMEPAQVPQLQFRELFQDELRFIVSPLHPWAKARKVTRSEIVQQKFILYTRTSFMVRLIQDYFREEDVVLPTYIELGNIEAIKELVKLGLGIGILAPWVCKAELQEGSLVSLPLGARKLKRKWGILHWKARRLSLAEETFVGLCKSVTESL